LRNRKTKQQLVDDNEQAARIALYLPQLHAQKEKLEADLQELEHLALSGWGYADFHAGVNFRFTEFSEVHQGKFSKITHLRDVPGSRSLLQW
jgi:hypothetical protein